MKNDKWVKRWTVKGSNGKEWTVAIDKDGNYGCSCPVWKFRRQECHHITQIMANGGNEMQTREARPGNVGEIGSYIENKDEIILGLQKSKPKLDKVGRKVLEEEGLIEMEGRKIKLTEKAIKKILERSLE
jgi:hypothetical protein